MEPDNINLSAEEVATITSKDSLNVNIGVLGHVDSGKTSICRILSEITSTASLDKNPQSQERGITLDLGFSAFFTRTPPNLAEAAKGKKYLQFTLVDCPGHASLLKTVIGGAQIIDIMFLIIDINKLTKFSGLQGIQTQTAECISIGQLFIDKLIIILNKVDMMEQEGSKPEEVQALINKKTDALKKIFGKTKYGSNPTIQLFSTKKNEAKYAAELKQTLLNAITIPQRTDKGPFMMLIDHCFPIKGKGTVVTGTVIQGSVKPGDQVQFPLVDERKKVKSLQMFKKPVNSGIQGDRIAMLFTQLQNETIQRGIACTPHCMNKVEACIIQFNKIKYFKLPICTKNKYHIISGHQTVMGQLRLFYSQKAPHSKEGGFDFKQQYECLDGFEEVGESGKQASGVFALLVFEKQLYVNKGTLLVAYKFDGDINENICRLAYYGPVLETIKQEQIKEGDMLRIYKNKKKFGQVDRIVDAHTIIVKDLFKKEVNINNFVGKEVEIEETGNIGRVQGGFGNSGKAKVYFDRPVLLGKEDQEVDAVKVQESRVCMNYKKYYLAKKDKKEHK